MALGEPALLHPDAIQASFLSYSMHSLQLPSPPPPASRYSLCLGFTRFPEGGGRSIRLIEEDIDLCTATFMGIFITTSEPAHPGIDGTLFAAPGSRRSVSTPRQPSHTRVECSHAERASSLALPSLWIIVPAIRTPESGMNQLCPLDMEQTPRRQVCAPVVRRVGSDGILVKPYESATHVSVPRSSVDHRGVRSMTSEYVVHSHSR